MEKYQFLFNIIKKYGMLISLTFIIVMYYILYTIKNTEGFELLNENTETLTCSDMNNKIVFISGIQNRYFSIFDKFYCFIYDDICFNSEMYNEQALLIKEHLEMNNLYVQKILLNDIMTGHLWGTMYNFPCKIYSTNSTIEMTSKCNKIYPKLNCEYVNMLHTDSMTKVNNFTCITNFSTKIYYYNQSEIKQYFNNVSNLLIVKGIFIISYINNFDKLNQIYGIFNNDKNTYLRRNYVYKLKRVKSSNNELNFEETIYKKNNSNNPKINNHSLNKYSCDKLIKYAQKYNFEVIHNVYTSKSRKCFGYLIFKKVR